MKNSNTNFMNLSQRFQIHIYSYSETVSCITFFLFVVQLRKREKLHTSDTIETHRK